MGVTERPVEVSMGDGVSMAGIWICHFIQVLGHAGRARHCAFFCKTVNYLPNFILKLGNKPNVEE